MKSEVGIIIASHGKFCFGAKDSLEMIIGYSKNLECVSVQTTMHVDEVNKKLFNKYMKLMKTCKEIIIFTDLYSGTPNNTAVKLMLEHDNITVITGFNLGILVEIVNRRNTSELKANELISDVKEIAELSVHVFKK